MMTMRTKLSVLTAFVLAFALSATPARAAAIIDFGTALAGAGGTISWAGGSSSLVGDGVRIGAVTGSSTPANAGAHFVTDGTDVPLSSYGVLNFTTGSFLGYSSGQYSYAGGGTFEIWGDVPGAAGLTGGAGPGTANCAGCYLLLSGTMSTPVTMTN